MRVTDVIYENNQPVSETHARALAINEVLEESLSGFLDRQRTRLLWSVGGGAAVAVVGFVLLVSGTILGLAGLLLGIGIAGGGYYYVQNQEPDVQIQGLKKGYWTGYSLPSEDGVLFYDATATVPASEFELEQVAEKDKVTQAKSDLEGMDEFPVVMTDDQNVEEEFMSVLESVESELEATETNKVEATVLTEESPETRAITSLIEHADSETVPAKAEIDVDQAAEDLAKLSELGNLARENSLEEELETVKETSQEAAEDLSAHQDEAVETLNDHIQMAADAFGIVSYNFYCSACQEDDVESRLVVSDDGDDLYCETCRSTQSREDAIPRHKIKDDIVLPTWDQLWAEKADEKRKIYENIEDQKQELKENEYQQFREEIRTTTERIRDMRSKIRDLQTQAQAAQGTVEEIGDLMVKYERLNEERKREFTNEVNRAYQEIDKETEQILKETRSEEQQRLEEAEKEAEQKAEMLRVEERQRQAEMLAAQREMQENIATAQMEQNKELTKAQMKHEAESTEAELQQESKHHRENWMLKTRGKTSFSDRIDVMKQKKDRAVGASARGD